MKRLALILILSAIPTTALADICSDYNDGGPCTATEQMFVDSNPDCYTCLVNAECLDDTIYSDVGNECEDLVGTATAGPAYGMTRTDLCLGEIACILKTFCGSEDITSCYCGEITGPMCAWDQHPLDANGQCWQQNIDGTEHNTTDPPSAVDPDIVNTHLGAGRANDIFSCGMGNGCV